MSHDRHRPGAEKCARSEDLAAYLAEELTAGERAGLESHLAACRSCSLELEAVRRTLEALKSVAPARAGRDLAPEVLARLQSEAPRPALWRTVCSAAAALALLLGGTLLLRSTLKSGPGGATAVAERNRPDAREDAVAWLCRTQEADGSWNAERWGGDNRFGVALSSLATLAILGKDSPSPDTLASAGKAARYLIGQQSASGEITPQFDNAPYNHGMATLALLRAFEVLREPALKPPLDQALAVIRKRQRPDGGWGYWEGSARESNLSVTLWQLEALRLAAAMGWDEARPSEQRAVRWVASVASSKGSFGYQQTDDTPKDTDTLTAMGALAVLGSPDKVLPADWGGRVAAKVRKTATDSGTTLDYYRAYFLTAAMKKMQDEKGGPELAMVRNGLVKRQVVTGDGSGSWDPDAQWGNVGGRVYATAMASLSLQ